MKFILKLLTYIMILIFILMILYSIICFGWQLWGTNSNALDGFFGLHPVLVTIRDFLVVQLPSSFNLSQIIWAQWGFGISIMLLVFPVSAIHYISKVNKKVDRD